MVILRRSSVFALGILFLLFQSTFQQSGTFSERLSLIQLRSSLGLRARDWPRKSHHCKWSGVGCRSGRVTWINISGFRRTRRGGENPQFAVDAMANLSSLEYFNASGFLLPGSIPNWFGQRLVALQVLDLRSCSVNGSIPSSLGNLKNLTALHLSHNALIGTIPSSLGQLGSLSVLDLAGNSLNGVIPSFALLMNLIVLDLSSNVLFGTIPPAIGVLSKLQVLNLSNNSLSSSIPPQLGDLSSLVELDLSFNSLSGSVPADLSGLSNLRKLVLGNNLLAGSLPDNLFPPLNKLQFIFLNHNGFVGGLPYALWFLPELSLLDASGNNFTGTLPSFGAGANATTAALLNLSSNMFYGGLTSAITRFRFVDLTASYLEGPISDYARSYASLDKNCLQNSTTQRSLEECKSFYAENGLQFDNFGLPNETPPTPAPARKSKRMWIFVLAGALGGALFLGLLVIVLVILRIRKRGVVHQRDMAVGPVAGDGSSQNPELSLEFPNNPVETFTFDQVLQATDNFSDTNLVKNGSSGDLYRALLDYGRPAVIKRIHLLSVKKETHMSELNFFSKNYSTRFVPFLGHCLVNENEKFLVYKYLPNGDLSTALYKKKYSEDGSLQSLDWITRMKIAIGAAEALSYLHHECTPPLVHRDVQASSILLDDKFEVRLGSLGEVCAQEDTNQRMITRLLRMQTLSEQKTSGASCTYDVYCFGKVLLELVTGKLGISAPNDNKLKDWLEDALSYITIYEKESVTKIVDPSLIVDDDLLEEVWAMAIVAKSCLNPKPSRRPLMRYVLKALENPLKVVRDESYNSSGRLRTTSSSKSSWNATAFGSWRRSSSDVMAFPATQAAAVGGGGGGSMYKQSGLSGSRGSGGQYGGGGDRSSSSRRHSKEIFPERGGIEV